VNSAYDGEDQRSPLAQAVALLGVDSAKMSWYAWVHDSSGHGVLAKKAPQRQESYESLLSSDATLTDVPTGQFSPTHTYPPAPTPSSVIVSPPFPRSTCEARLAFSTAFRDGRVLWSPSSDVPGMRGD
jgi:hypothetical protein